MIAMRPTVCLAAGLSLAATAALAQQTKPPHVDMPISAQLNRLDTQALGVRPLSAPIPTERNAVAVTYPEAAVVAGDRSPYLSDNVSGPTAGAIEVKSRPVPDTPDNRRLYKPLSRAGQKTAAAAN
jgi:hypothetical protein